MRPVQIVIVAYHQPEALRRCLMAAADVRITVVDNSSNAAVQEVAEATGAQYFDPGRNLGFGAGVNVALRNVLAGPETDVLLLNPDAMFRTADLRTLQATLHRPENALVGAISPTLKGLDNSQQRVMWPYPTPWAAWTEALGFGSRNRGEDFAVGAALLLRWEALQDVGLFDERFFLYAEETDWQRRAFQYGWTTALAPNLVAEHLGGGSSSDEGRRLALFHSGGETYQRKWHGNVGWQVYRAAVIAGCLPRIIHPQANTRRSAALRLSLYLRGPRRAAGLEG